MAIVRLANGKTFEASEGVSLLESARLVGLSLEHSCRSGRCNSCKARVVVGDTVLLKPEHGLTDADRRQGSILTCVRAAACDVSLDIEDLGELANMPRRTLPCRIQGLERLKHDVMRVSLRLPPQAAFKYLAGQYIDVIGPQGVRRSYSLANANSPDAAGLELHVRAVPGGVMSGYWFDRARPNDLLRLDGPLGTFFLRDAPGADVAFLATGTGMAPVKAMLEDLACRPTRQWPPRISVWWGCRSEDEHYLDPDSGTLAFGALNVEWVQVASRPSAKWTGVKGHVQDAFVATGPDLSRTWVYACGSGDMIESARRLLHTKGLPERRFCSDAFVPSN